MPTVKQAIQRLQGYDPESTIAIAIWCEEDVIGRAKQRGLIITREQAQEVLDNMERKHDCELGITWTTIDCWLDELPALEDEVLYVIHRSDIDTVLTQEELDITPEQKLEVASRISNKDFSDDYEAIKSIIEEVINEEED